MVELLDVKYIPNDRKKRLLEFIDECRASVARGEVSDAFFIVQDASHSGWTCLSISNQTAQFMVGALEMLKMRYALGCFQAADTIP